MRTAASMFKDRKIRAVEIGVAGGTHALEMLMNNHKMHLVLVDPYKTYYTETHYEMQRSFHQHKKEEMIHKLQPFLDRVEMLFMESVEAADKFKDGHFDLVYIDGDHDRKAVLADIQAWKSKVKKGGLLAGHDFDIVGEAVKELLPDVEHDTIRRSSSRTDWWIRL